MDFDLSPQQEELLAGVRDLTGRFDLDYWRRCDAAHAFPEEFWEALTRGGWLGLVAPTEVGGAGLGLIEASLVTEELAAGGAGSQPPSSTVSRSSSRSCRSHERGRLPSGPPTCRPCFAERSRRVWA